MAFKLEKLLMKGAEAEIWKGVWFGLEAIFKIRKSKPWRHPLLDRKILESRTLKEARIIYSAFLHGIDVPFIYDVDKNNFSIVMEYVRGKTLKDLLSEKNPKIEYLCEELGSIVAMLHKISIVHGDLTPANVVLREEGSLCILDFGLADFSNRIEDRGVDLHLMLRALESSFSSLQNLCFESFKRGYSKVAENPELVFEKVKEIRRRGRYVLERRRKFYAL